MDDRRENERYEYQCPLWFGEDVQNLWRGTMMDLCRGGLTVISAEGSDLQVGQVLLIQFSPPRTDSANGRAITRAARICRVESLDDGHCHIAVQLLEPLSLQFLQLSTSNR